MKLSPRQKITTLYFVVFPLGFLAFAGMGIALAEPLAYAIFPWAFVVQELAFTVRCDLCGTRVERATVRLFGIFRIPLSLSFLPPRNCRKCGKPL